eukprot:m.147075 g.147075  ORF g.147075 m.147075 type:complete len:100 (+) comp38462_c0_seq1:204-503(+)
MERTPTDSQLSRLSRKISINWKHLARILEVPKNAIEQISKNYHDDVREQAFQMLSWWKENSGKSASVDCLCSVLLDENLKTATEIFQLCDTTLDKNFKK